MTRFTLRHRHTVPSCVAGGFVAFSPGFARTSARLGIVCGGGTREYPADSRQAMTGRRHPPVCLLDPAETRFSSRRLKVSVVPERRGRSGAIHPLASVRGTADTLGHRLDR